MTLRLKRSAGKIVLERSPDGAAFTEIGSRAIGTGTSQVAFGDQALVGLTVSGGGSPARALFRAVSGPPFQEAVDPRPTFRRGDGDSNGSLELTDETPDLGSVKEC